MHVGNCQCFEFIIMGLSIDLCTRRVESCLDNASRDFPAVCCFAELSAETGLGSKMPPFKKNFASLSGKKPGRDSHARAKLVTGRLDVSSAL